MKTISKNKANYVTLMGILAIVLVIFSATPIGSIPIGALCITLNVIPVAIAGVILGRLGGSIMGGVFGLLSFLQCFGIGVPSSFGAILLENNVFFTFIVCVVSRILAGFLTGFVKNLLRKKLNPYVVPLITGFSAALLNTLFFMTSLVLLFGQTDYLQHMMGEQNVFIFICNFVGINAVVEMFTATAVTGIICTALYKSKFIDVSSANNQLA